jgi:hypothetical protein
MNPPYQDPALPQQQPTDEDLLAFTQPVAEMDMSQPAAPVAQPRAAKGLSFDWSVLNAQTQEEYDAKPPAIQHLIHEIQQLGTLPSQEWAANRVLEIQKNIDERNSPQAQAQLQKAKIDIEKASAEAAQAQQRKQAAASEIANMRTMLSDLKSHAGMSTSIGAKGAEYLFGMKKEPIAGTKAADFYSLLEQVQGGTFMQAFNNLKGAGQITEQEGAKATAAIARLNARQSEEGFGKALMDFDGVLAQAQARSQPATEQGAPAAPQQGAPQSAAAPVKMIGNRKFVLQPNGKYVESR